VTHQPAVVYTNPSPQPAKVPEPEPQRFAKAMFDFPPENERELELRVCRLFYLPFMITFRRETSLKFSKKLTNGGSVFCPTEEKATSLTIMWKRSATGKCENGCCGGFYVI
jgi:hypothetical protein